MEYGEGNHLFRCEVFPPQTPPFLATTKGLAALWTLARWLVLGSGDVSLRDWDGC